MGEIDKDRNHEIQLLLNKEDALKPEAIRRLALHWAAEVKDRAWARQCLIMAKAANELVAMAREAEDESPENDLKAWDLALEKERVGAG